MPDTSVELLRSIDRKLGSLLSLMAYQTVRDMTIAEGAPLLRRLGFSPGDIAAVFDSTVNAVSVRLAEAKKKGQAKKRK